MTFGSIIIGSSELEGSSKDLLIQLTAGSHLAPTAVVIKLQS